MHANLRKAMRVLAQAYDAALRSSGLKATQFTLLAVLARAGSQPLTRLSERLVMDRTTLTRNLQPLEAKGWLTIGREKDERVRLIAITEAGRQVVEVATPLWRQAQDRVRSKIGSDGMAGLIGGLDALVEAVRGR
jgi:DNA-binding MarR family transcriptional regulator